jgi:hypothetical protein
MALRIITADERQAEARGIKAVIFGKSGIGKTYLLLTLDEGTTLFIDLEAGDLAVQHWRGASIRPRTWEECRDLALFLAGPNPALRDDQPYSAAQYARVLQVYGDPARMDGFATIFVDSITVAGRLCFQWCRGQPEDFNRKVFVPQIDGSKTGLELPGIVDQVMTLAEIKMDAPVGKAPPAPFRGLVCQTINPWGYPAKDRSGRLNVLEPPHLGQLFQKIRTPVPQGVAHDPPSLALAAPTDIPTT